MKINLFWTRSKIKELKGQAAAAQGRIRDLFVDRMISLGGDRYAWGQFLDERRNYIQYGIYGTSAGIQVLVSSGHSLQSQPVSSAADVLRRAFEDKTTNNRFYEKRDLSVLYKIAYLAQANYPSEEDINIESKLMEELMNRILDGQGWGEYFDSESIKDEQPKIVPTAIALLTLSRYRKFRSSQESERVLQWLCNRLLENGNKPAYELALASLAVLQYSYLRERISNYEEVCSACKQHLVNWARARPESLFGSLENYHYLTNQETRSASSSRYLFFLPDCLVGLALLKFGSPKHTRRYVLDVISLFTKNIHERKGFAPNATKQFSTVDHLWIFRLLQEFKSKPVGTLMPKSYLRWAGAPLPLRILFALFLLGIACLGLYKQYTMNNSSDGNALRVFWIIIGGLGLGLLVTLIWEFAIKGKDDGSN